MKFYTTSKISENMHETPEGYLVCVGVSIARTGEMIYAAGETPIRPSPDGTVVIQREASEVFSPQTMASFEAKPVTITHPSDFVDPESWKKLTKGIIQNVRRGTGAGENDLVADLLITDKDAIQLIRAGLREVSCGYEAEYIETGIGRGIQKKILGNHLALVEQGRAGSSYAINDHIGKGSKMTLHDRIKSIFGKAQDEALKAASETKDASGEAVTTPVSGFVSYDDFKKAMDKIEAFMGKNNDATTKPTMSEPAHVEAKDEEAEKKKAARDAWIDAMMEKEAKDAAACDEDKEDKGESEDDDFEESTMSGDAASRIEILSPGMQYSGKSNAKVKALLAAYATKEGKTVIDQFTGGKMFDAKDGKTVDALFVGVSEVLKTKRSQDLAGTKAMTGDAGAPKSGPKTPEEINQINAAFWEKRTAK